MKRIVLLLQILISLTVFVSAQTTVRVIPKPISILEEKGVFTISSATNLAAPEVLKKRALQLRNYIAPALGYDLTIISKPRGKNEIEFRVDKSLKNLGEEGYQLNVTPAKIILSAFSEKGIFWGIQTIRQLLPEQIHRSSMVNGVAWELPCLSIEDNPRFKWRGLMLDCSRTFISKEEVKKYIEVLSFFKMNVLHMHLTDDQGWRIEIKKYPELTRIASRFHPSYNEPEEYQGFYSQEDMKEIIGFAADRNVEIVPEIEMPGHSYEVFAALPQLSCKGDTAIIHPWTRGAGIHNEIFCAGKDQTFVFLENILDEITTLFPSQYVHIGGDEAPKAHWKTCEKCQKRIKDLGLKDENELQSWFVKRIEKYLNSKGKKLIGWDEIMDGGLSKSATVMYWRSWDKSVAQKIPSIENDIVMTPTSHCYFDYTYEKISTEKMYAFNPVFNKNQPNDNKNILGVQANFWSHLDRTAPRIDRQLFPRLLALAEVGWTQNDRKDWGDFKARLDSKLKILDTMGIYYFGKN
ncbi:MAG: beta-N-acetylhexosaminidase [Mariniphaga sp.]